LAAAHILDQSAILKRLQNAAGRDAAHSLDLRLGYGLAVGDDSGGFERRAG